MTGDASRPAVNGAAHLPALRAALGLITGTWDAGAAPCAITQPQGGMDAAAQDRVRADADRVLAGDLTPARTDRDAVAAVLRPILGADHGAYLELALEELAIDRPDPRAPGFAADRPLRAVIVGAGMSGLLAAHRLRQAGVAVTVLDRQAGPGGTWWANAYPGCRVDVPSHVYTYSCDRDRDWADHFATRDAVQAGFAAFAAETGVAEDVRCGVEVQRCDHRDGRWTVTLRGGETLDADLVVSAVGQLSRPSVPPLPGTFAGSAFHAAAWDGTVDLRGRRVAVVGTGATAVQLVPALADVADRVTVYERTPTWLMPTPELRAPVDGAERARLRTVPFYQRFLRLYVQRMVADGLLPFARVDPEWTAPGSVSARNDAVRRMLTAHLAGTPARVPDYPPFAKRVVRDDGAWGATLARDDVELVTAPIEGLVADGIVAGEHRRHDTVLYATGFEASRFLVPMRVTGPGGDLHERWGDDASAHLGMTVPGFPNLFLLYGPNTNVVVNGSAVFQTECQVSYLLGCVRLMLERGAALDCRPDVHADFRDEMAARNAGMAWGASGVHSWYRSPSGRVTQNWPGTVLEYWQRTRAPDPTHFQFLDAREAAHA